MSNSNVIDYERLMSQIQKFEHFVHFKNKERGFDDKGIITFRDRNGFLGTEEDYKTDIVTKARNALNVQDWKEDWIGTGRIADCAAKAMSQAGNLVNKNQQINFKNRLNPEHSAYQPEAEKTLYRLYCGEDEVAAFDEATKTFGAKYDTIAYLFFVKDDTRFLPVSSRNFDISFSELGIDYSMEGKCSLNNYQGFIEIIDEIRKVLDENLSIAGQLRLLDAHSFVWILHEPRYMNWADPATGAETKVNATEKYRLQRRRKQQYRDQRYPKKYVTPIKLEKSDWKRLLVNEDIFTANDIELLKRIYSADNHAMTATELALKEGTSPSSYNSPVVALAKRIAKEENLEPIYQNNGKRIWWRVLFWGSYRNDNHFEWKLRPELADALAELFPQLELFVNETEDDDNLIDDLGHSPLSQADGSFDYHGKPKDKQPPIYTKGHPSRPRSRLTATNALVHAGFKCEYDNSHFTFTRKNSDKPYTEPHHLIPLAYEDDFQYSLDVEENIISLCSNCHNWIHYGKNADVLLRKLYEERIDLLRKVGLDISLEALLNMYDIT